MQGRAAEAVLPPPRAVLPRDNMGGKGKDKGKEKGSYKGKEKGREKGKGKGKEKGKRKGEEDLSEEDKLRLREEREAGSAEFFAGLPVGELTPEESHLRDVLLAAVGEIGSARLSIVAQREEVRQAKTALGLPKGTMTQWVGLRISEDLVLITDTSVTEPLLCVAGQEHEAAAAQTGDPFEDFYSALPEGDFTEGEGELRVQVLEALERNGGSGRLAAISRGDGSRELQLARQAVLPKGAPLLEWIERRMGGEVRVNGSNGTKILEVINNSSKGSKKGASKGGKKGASASIGKANAPPEQMPDEEFAAEDAKLAREAKTEEFINSLPQDALTPEEQALRQAIIASLQEKGGGPARFSVVCQSAAVSQAKQACLPPGIPTGAWVAGRIGAEVILDGNGGGGHVMASLGVLETPVQARGGDSYVDNYVASGLKPSEERDARMAAYFTGPFQPIEEALKRALTEACIRNDGAAQRLSDILNNDADTAAAWKRAKSAWLVMNPPLEATFAKWVELRLSDEVRVTREPYVQLTRQSLERLGMGNKRRGGQDATNERPAKAARSEGPPGGYGKGSSGGAKGGGKGSNFATLGGAIGAPRTAAPGVYASTGGAAAARAAYGKGGKR